MLTLHCNYYKCAWLFLFHLHFIWPCKHSRRWHSFMRQLHFHCRIQRMLLHIVDFFLVHIFCSLLPKDCVYVCVRVDMHCAVCTISLSHNACILFQWKRWKIPNAWENDKREMKCVRNKPIWHGGRDLGLFRFTWFLLESLLFVLHHFRDLMPSFK